MHSQVRKGTIPVQKDPKDPDEWQFGMEQEVAYEKEESKHEHTADAKGKLEASQWMEVRAKGLFEPGPGHEQNEASQALAAMLSTKNKRKEPLALEDKNRSDDHESGNAGPSCNEKKSKGKDEPEVEAEVLSEVGSKKMAKEEASTRVKRMLALTKKVKTEVPKEHRDILSKVIARLEKLSKLGNKVSLEAAKDVLFDGAVAIKKAKAM